MTVAFVTLDVCLLHGKTSLCISFLWLSLTLSHPFPFPFLFALPYLSPHPPGRVSLTRDASLLVERLTLEDEGWFECRILLLESEKDDFQNGTWTFLSITGAALQVFVTLDLLALFRTATAWKLAVTLNVLAQNCPEQHIRTSVIFYVLRDQIFFYCLYLHPTFHK